MVAADWNGTLPDNFRHDVLGDPVSPTGGWDANDQTMQDRVRIHLNVPVTGTDPATDVVTLCIDYTPADWLFPPVVPTFGGPYCFDFLGIPNLPPTISTQPISLSAQHHQAFFGTWTLADVEGDPITAVVALDENGDPIGTVVKSGNSFTWSYNPPCSWVTDGLSHTVTFYAEDNVNGHFAPNTPPQVVSLETLNTDPVITECPGAKTIGLSPYSFDFASTDLNVDADEVAQWTVSAVPLPTGLFSIDLNTGLFAYTPDGADDGGTFVFTVVVTDCAGGTDECIMTLSPVGSVPFAFAIEYEDGNPGKGGVDGLGHYLGQHAYVDVLKLGGSEYLFGFDFMIAYDNSALALFGVNANPAVFNPQGWEYFTWRFGDNCGGGCPSGLVEVVAIADQNNGIPFMGSNLLADGTVLFTMDFFVSNNYTLECSFVPIYFFWTECPDNSVAFQYATATVEHCIKQGVSNMIYSPAGPIDMGDVDPLDPIASGYALIHDPYVDPDHTFPTSHGAPWVPCDPLGFDDELVGECEGVYAKYPIRIVDFFNGGIKIICSDEIDARGDINLNGVMNEIADAVVFTNYFIYGMSAFTISEEGQKAATDVNADGVVLSVADLVYLIRIVVGDILPIPKLTPNMVDANFGHNGQLVTVDVALGAALFVFEGNVDVELAQDAAHMEIKSGVVNGNTNVLVYSFDRGATFSGNILNTQGTLISVEAADYNGSAYKTIMVPTSFSVKSYPNPFNASANIEMALPVASNWNLTIYNVAGQKVAEFSGFAEAGINNVIWDASTSASGIYFYKVTTNEGSLTKKMVLLK